MLRVQRGSSDHEDRIKFACGKILYCRHLAWLTPTGFFRRSLHIVDHVDPRSIRRLADSTIPAFSLHILPTGNIS
jgi:hypothetical protein